MYKKLDESLGNILGFKLSGELTEEELKEISDEISLTASDMGKICLLFEFEDLQKLPESMTMPGVHNFTSRFKEKFKCMKPDCREDLGVPNPLSYDTNTPLSGYIPALYRSFIIFPNPVPFIHTLIE